MQATARKWVKGKVNVNLSTDDGRYANVEFDGYRLGNVGVADRFPGEKRGRWMLAHQPSGQGFCPTFDRLKDAKQVGEFILNRIGHLIDRMADQKGTPEEDKFCRQVGIEVRTMHRQLQGR